MFPKGYITMALNDDAAKEWDAFGYRSLTTSSISYEPKINIRTV